MLSAVPIFVLLSQNEGQHEKVAPGHKTLNTVTIICLWVVTFVLSKRHYYFLSCSSYGSQKYYSGKLCSTDYIRLNRRCLADFACKLNREANHTNYCVVE